MDDEGNCTSCGSEMYISMYLQPDNEVSAVLLCPQCDQPTPPDVIRPDDFPPADPD